MVPAVMELLTTALGSRRAARALAADTRSIRRALEIPGEDLVARFRVPPARAQVWEALRLLRARAATEAAGRGTRLDTPQALRLAAMPLFEGLCREVFYVLPVDSKLRLVCPPVRVGEGGPDFVHVAARRVFQTLLREEAAAAFIAHNHPSGDPTPSEEDRRLTQELSRVGAALGVRILDHLIVGEGRAVALSQSIEVAAWSER